MFYMLFDDWYRDLYTFLDY